MNTLTLSVHRHYIQAALCHFSGAISRYREFPWIDENSLEALAAYLLTIVDQYKGYQAVGVAVRTLLSNNSSLGILSRNLPGRGALPLRSIIMEHTGVPTLVASHIEAIAKAAHAYGSSGAFSRVLYLHIGSEIESAFILNNTVYGGSVGLAGGLGHIVLYPDGLSCHCGQYGCFEQYASSAALVRRAKFIDPTLHTGRDVMTALKGGNFALQKVLADWESDLLHGLSTCIHAFAPEAVVLSGGIMNEPEVFQHIQRNIHSRITPYYHTVRILHRELAREAPLQGIALLTREHV